MPKLSPLHWLAFAALLFFYGFTVFALTRDYYLRHPTRPVAAQSPSSPNSASGALSQVGGSAIPESIAETNPELLHQRADQLFVEQRYAEAVAVYRRILELSPEDAEAHNDLGLALLYTGDQAGAIASLKAAVAKDPTLQRPWLTFGFVNLQTGNRAEAQEALERARDLDPNSEIGKEAVRLLGILAAQQ
ncbi:tetratricopeptide repeat protein [Thiocystis violascens]|uniref:Tetratricopeptide repeat protein n=1 Tax=Thiocystis violascens (strain ATCC 17096 / DSM 198 / 6111) TaxID=765911 RepID=I3YEX6_THIV6|nr:tetratricopeptide repeat protein [Thiocystis violascens]AFL75544.1 tetratricopeptide repeat protein [Thiocystis violascens DSM 198]